MRTRRGYFPANKQQRLIIQPYRITVKRSIMTRAKTYYRFRWDGGDLPRRHEAFSFECDADAMMAAREFMNKHHIDIINVFEGDGTDMRYIVSYTK